MICSVLYGLLRQFVASLLHSKICPPPLSSYLFSKLVHGDFSALSGTVPLAFPKWIGKTFFRYLIVQVAWEAVKVSGKSLCYHKKEGKNKNS